MSLCIGRDEIEMYINLNQMHLFDMETEERIIIRLVRDD